MCSDNFLNFNFYAQGNGLAKHVDREEFGTTPYRDSAGQIDDLPKLCWLYPCLSDLLSAYRPLLQKLEFDEFPIQEWSNPG